MNIRDIEAAVDKITSGKKAGDCCEKKPVHSRVHSERLEEVFVTKQSKSKTEKISPDTFVSRLGDRSVVCTGCHASVVQSIISARKKAM